MPPVPIENKPNVPALTGNIFFDYIEFDGQLLRSIAKCARGGADYGECMATAFQIEEGNYESWHREWFKLAERTFEQAKLCEAANHSVSAKIAYLRACEYFRQAQWFLRDNLSDSRILFLADRIRLAFTKAIPFLPFPVKAIEIPFENKIMYGYFCQTTQKNYKATVILPSGYDSYVEELYFYAVFLLERGYNVLIFDGPGQGHTLVRNHIYMRPDWENVIPSVIHFAIHTLDLMPNKIVMMGRSLGGYLASRSASFDFPFAALIVDPGTFDLYIVAKKIIPAAILEKIELNKDEEAYENYFKKIFEDPKKSFFFKWRMAVHGSQNVCEWIRTIKNYTLSGYAEKINCPVLVCYAEQEHLAPGQVNLLPQALTSAQSVHTIFFTTTEGAGDHCEAGAPYLFEQKVGDWLDETLG